MAFRGRPRRPPRKPPERPPPPHPKGGAASPINTYTKYITLLWLSLAHTARNTVHNKQALEGLRQELLQMDLAHKHLRHTTTIAISQRAWNLNIPKHLHPQLLLESVHQPCKQAELMMIRWQHSMQKLVNSYAPQAPASPTIHHLNVTIKPLQVAAIPDLVLWPE